MAGDPAFEQWVSRQLHKAYDEVLAEEVPRELLDLVERWTGDGADDAATAEPERPPRGTKPKPRQP